MRSRYFKDGGNQEREKGRERWESERSTFLKSYFLLIVLHPLERRDEDKKTKKKEKQKSRCISNYLVLLFSSFSNLVIFHFPAFFVSFLCFFFSFPLVTFSYTALRSFFVHEKPFIRFSTSNFCIAVVIILLLLLLYHSELSRRNACKQ